MNEETILIGEVYASFVKAEIAQRRARVRSAAALADALVEAADGEPILPGRRRPTTVAGIARERARRIQLRERCSL